MKDVYQLLLGLVIKLHIGLSNFALFQVQVETACMPLVGG